MVLKPPTLITRVLEFVLGVTNEKLYQVASVREAIGVERKGRGQVDTDKMPFTSWDGGKLPRNEEKTGGAFNDQSCKLRCGRGCGKKGYGV